MLKIIASMFLTGLLFGSGPCLLSCGPVLFSYIAATKKNVYSGFITYVLFSVSRICVYAILSILIFLFGQFAAEKFLFDSSRYIFIFGGVFIILVGILLLFGSHISLKPLKALERIMVGWDKKNACILGAIYGLAPCGPFLALFFYIGLVSRSWLQSCAFALTFGLGTFLSPLLLLCFIPGLVGSTIAGFEKYMRLVSAGLLILLGLQILWRFFK